MQIHDGSQIKPALSSRNDCDVTDPALIGTVHRKLAVQKIGGAFVLRESIVTLNLRMVRGTMYVWHISLATMLRLHAYLTLLPLEAEQWQHNLRNVFNTLRWLDHLLTLH
jgi:hypothetical protein